MQASSGQVMPYVDGDAGGSPVARLRGLLSGTLHRASRSR